MLEISVQGSEELVDRLKSRPEALRLNTATRINGILVRMKAAISGPGGKLEGGVLQHRSGKLSASVHEIWAQPTEDVITGGMGASLGLPYGPIHEYGAVFSRLVTQAFGRPITPVSATFHYPERSYMRSTLSDFIEPIRAAMRAAVADTIK